MPAKLYFFQRDGSNNYRPCNGHPYHGIEAYKLERYLSDVEGTTRLGYRSRIMGLRDNKEIVIRIDDFPGACGIVRGQLWDRETGVEEFFWLVSPTWFVDAAASKYPTTPYTRPELTARLQAPKIERKRKAPVPVPAQDAAPEPVQAAPRRTRLPIHHKPAETRAAAPVPQKAKRLYCGLDHEGLTHVFVSAEPPTADTHGRQFQFWLGPFKTKAGAEYMQHNWNDCDDVKAAERAVARLAR